jgi:Flp pilus assembly protein TadD
MPTASEIQNHLGLAYWSDGREAAALRALERAVELDCDNEAARANLASLHRARGASGTAAATDATVGEGVGGVDDEERNASNGG